MIGLGNLIYKAKGFNVFFMMGVTHGLVGLLTGLTSQIIWEPLFFTAAMSAFVGGIFPDLDLLFKHRKTLHFPIGYTFAVPIAFVTAYFFPSQVTVAVLYFMLSASLHCIMDIFGGGLEPRPWKATSQEAVYSHTLQKWFKPKRWIRYDGSPEDLY